MFKNLSVGKKISVGYGLVILMTVLLMCIVILTSAQRSNDLTDTKDLASMSTEMNEVLARFDDARYACVTAFTVVNAESSYNDVYSSMDQALHHLDNVDAISKRLYGSASDAAAQLRSIFKSFTTAVRTVQENDANLSTEMDILSETAEQLSAISDTAFGHIIATAISEMDGRMSDSQQLESRIMAAQGLGTSINSLVVLNVELLGALDSGSIDDARDKITAIESESRQVYNLLVSPDAKREVENIQAGLLRYKEALTRFQDVLLHVDGIIGEAMTQMDSVSSTVTASVNEVEADMSALIASTLATSKSTAVFVTVVTAIAILVSAFLAWRLGRAITRPLAKMEVVLQQATGSGDLNFSEEVRNDVLKEAEARDELGRSLGAFGKFVDRIRYVGDILESIAAGDLTREIRLLSHEDTLGNAMVQMSEQLNSMFAEIKSVSDQVAVSSSELANGAQTLAQGATEQAATMQEISASVNEIKQLSDTSTETALQAAENGALIQRVAINGQEKMTAMSRAVNDMNDSSRAIEEVIKVIDDIAFQTNILALNAAVEAARAGEYGKGFAVVAEEVRSLAAKSADAAKKTAELISSNIKKAATGLALSEETEAILSTIVTDIQTANESLREIASQSQGSQAAIVEVNSAIDQVAQVIQQNSATSEESAAASEEMSSQAQFLRELISRFRLSEEEAKRMLPPPVGSESEFIDI